MRNFYIETLKLKKGVRKNDVFFKIYKKNFNEIFILTAFSIERNYRHDAK